VNFIEKTVLSAILLVTPLVYFIYQSSLAIDKQFKKNLTTPDSVSVNDNIEVLTDFSLTLSSAYTYTFIIGSCLFLVVVWKLFQIIVRKYRDANMNDKLYSEAAKSKAEKEIEKYTQKYSYYDHKKKKEIKDRLKRRR
jgi:hypothetical protein